MKKLIALITMVSAATAFSQGTVNFNNAAADNDGAGPNQTVIVPFVYDTTRGGPVTGTLPKINSAAAAQVTGADGFIYGGANAMAGLYGGPAGTAPSTFVLLTPAVGFKSGSSAGYINPGSSSFRNVASVAPGAAADFIVKLWDTGTAGVGTYEDAATIINSRGSGYLGQSSLIHVAALGGVGSPPSPSASLNGLVGQTVALQWVPEPSIIGLGILGAFAGLFVFRRRN